MSTKIVIGIHIDYIGNLEDLSSGGGLNRNINQKKKLDVLQAYRSPLRDKCYKRGNFCNKQVEYFESLR